MYSNMHAMKNEHDDRIVPENVLCTGVTSRGSKPSDSVVFIQEFNPTFGVIGQERGFNSLQGIPATEPMKTSSCHGNSEVPSDGLSFELAGSGSRNTIVVTGHAQSMSLTRLSVAENFMIDINGNKEHYGEIDLGSHITYTKVVFPTPEIVFEKYTPKEKVESFYFKNPKYKDNDFKHRFCSKGFEGLNKLNPRKVIWFFSLLDDFEMNNFPLVLVVEKMRKLKIPIRMFNHFSGLMPLNSFITHTTSSIHNEMLYYTYVSTTGVFYFKNPDVENIYLFGKKKKRPGGKMVLVCRSRCTEWFTEYWSRQYLLDLLKMAHWFIFKIGQCIYAISETAYSDMAKNGYDVSNIAHNKKIEDYSHSDDDFGDPVRCNGPDWMMFDEKASCTYCKLPGHHEYFCCLREADFQHKNLIKENSEVPLHQTQYIPKVQSEEKEQRDDIRIKNKKGNSPKNQKSNTRNKKNEKLIEVNKQQYYEKNSDPTAISKNDPDFLKVKEDFLQLDKQGLMGKLDNENQKKYNELRDRCLVIIGQIPEVRNFKFNRLLTFPICSLVNLITLSVTGNRLPTNFDVLKTNFYDFNNLLGPLSFVSKFGASLAGAAKQCDWVEKQFIEVQRWEAVDVVYPIDFDGRPDNQKNNPLNHVDPRETKFIVNTKLTSNTSIGKFALKANKMIKKYLPRLYCLIGMKTKKTLGNRHACLEIATNLITPSVDPLTISFLEAESRIHRAVNSTMTINYDKDSDLNNNYMIKNTAKLATVIHGRSRIEEIKPKTNKILLRNVIRGYRVGEVKLPNINGVELGKDVFFGELPKIPGFLRPVLAANLILKVNYKMPQPDTEDPQTTMAGLMKRICPKMPKPNPARLRKLKLFAKYEMRRLFKPISIDSDRSFEHWLSKTSYSDARKSELREKYGNIRDKFDDYYKKVPGFVKLEGYTEPKLPRGIYSRTDEFKCLVGPYFKLMEEIVYELPEFIKHVPVNERADVVERDIYKPGCKYMSSDYTSYESSFVSEIMEAIEFPLYKYLLSELPEGKEIFKLMRSTLGGVNCIVFKYVKLFLKARRMSGEMCTSLGNGWTNYIVTTFLFWENGEKAHMKVEGDDGLTRIENYCPNEMDYEMLGFKIKIDIFDDVSLASFCGMIYDKDDRAVIKNPFDVIADFFWVDRRYVTAKNSKHMELLRSKSLSLLYSYPGCPILKPMAKWLCRMTKDFVPNHNHLNSYQRDCLIRDEKFYLNHQDVLDRPIGINTRILMQTKYGIDIRDQLNLEQYFDDKNDLETFAHEIIDHYIPNAYKEFYNTYCEENINVYSEFELQTCVKQFSIVDPQMANINILEENQLLKGIVDKNAVAMRGQKIFYSRNICFSSETTTDRMPEKSNQGIFEDESSSDEHKPSAPEASDEEIRDHNNISKIQSKIRHYYQKFLDFFRTKPSAPPLEDDDMGSDETSHSCSIIIEEKDGSEDKVKNFSDKNMNSDVLFADYRNSNFMRNQIVKNTIAFVNPFLSWKNFVKFLFVTDEVNPTILGVQAGLEVVSIYYYGLRSTIIGNFWGLFLLHSLKFLKNLLSRTNSNYGNTNGLRCMSVQYREKNILQNFNNKIVLKMMNQNKKNSKTKKQLAALRRKINNRNRSLGNPNARKSRGGRVRSNMRSRGGPRINDITNSSSALAYGRTINNQLPKMEATYGKCRIRHREPLGPLLGSVDFTLTTFNVNPGMPITFPWLSTIARNYEKYKFRSLSFEYINRCNANFTGGLVIAPDYDAGDIAPTDITTLQQYQNAYDGSIWKDGKAIINGSGMGPTKYIRTETLAANLDIKTYDVANVYVATEGQLDASKVGNLWVHYDVDLFIPQAASMFNIFNVGTLYNDTGSGSLTNDIMGDDPIAEGAIVISKVLNVITIRNLVVTRRYRCTLQITAATLASSGSITCTTHCVNLNSADMGDKVYVISTTDSCVVRDIVPSQTSCVVTLGGYTTITTPSKVLFSIMPINNLSD